jgi:hypothetical protein
MKPVILESPYAGDVKKNRKYLNRCILDSLMRGEAPVASHKMYTDSLDDKIPEQRELGIEAGLSLNSVIKDVVVYVDNGISDGMRRAICFHGESGCSIEYRKVGEL